MTASAKPTRAVLVSRRDFLRPAEPETPVKFDLGRPSRIAEPSAAESPRATTTTPTAPLSQTVRLYTRRRVARSQYLAAFRSKRAGDEAL
jgi:hypothetical protein